MHLKTIAIYALIALCSCGQEASPPGIAGEPTLLAEGVVAPAKETEPKPPPPQKETEAKPPAKETEAKPATKATESKSPAPKETESKSPAPGIDPNFDVNTLAERLRASSAIGVFTKLALKNEVDDLLEAFRRFHAARDGQLAELRERFNLLLMKIISLLQNKDPKLSKDIFNAREVLWAKLVDPKEFSKI